MANLVWLQGSFALGDGQRWEWGGMGLKAIFCFLTANRIKLTFGRGVDGAWLKATCPKSLVFSSLVYTSVAEKSI